MRGRWICLQSKFLGYATVVNLNRTKSFLFDLKCTKIAGGWGSTPDPAGGAYSAPPDPLAVTGGGEGRGGKREGRGGEERGGDFAILPPQPQLPGYATGLTVIRIPPPPTCACLHRIPTKKICVVQILKLRYYMHKTSKQHQLHVINRQSSACIVLILRIFTNDFKARVSIH